MFEMSSARFVSLVATTVLFALGGLFASGCTTVGPVRESCARVAVDPAPIWTAAASWTGRGDRLWVVDPEIRGLLAFDLDGHLVDRVEDPDLAGLNYSLPIRLEPAGRSVVIGGRGSVLQVRRWAVSPVFGNVSDEVTGTDEIFLGDWTLVDDQLVGYADMVLDDESWGQGFVRVGRHGIERLLDLPLEPGGEYLRYHDYFQRPYIARLGDQVFVLRYTEPATVSRVVESGLEEIWRATTTDEKVRYAALLGWDQALYLVSSLKIEVPIVDEPTAPQPLSTTGDMKLEAMSRVRTHNRWELLRLEPGSGKITWRRPLPTAHRPVLAPGPRAWAMIDGKTTPQLNQEEAEPTWLTLMPTDHFGAIAPARFCANLTPIQMGSVPSSAAPSVPAAQ